MRKNYENTELKDLNDEIITDIVGNTYFDIIYGDEGITIETRDGGDVGNETPGLDDIEAAREMCGKFMRALPLVSVNMEMADERTIITLKAYTPDSLDRHMKMIAEVEDKITELVEGRS